jgi:hypothetical protein
MAVKKNIILFLFLFLLVSPAYADRIFLKGGNFIDGKIIEDDSTGVLLAINQEQKGASASKVPRARISSLEIDTRESQTPFTSLESKEKIFKKNILTEDSTIFLDSKYGFYIEVYSSYHLTRRDVVRDEALFTSSSGEVLMIGVFACDRKEKNAILSGYGQALSVTPGMNKKIHWQGMDVYQKKSHEYHKKIRMARTEYLLFSRGRDDFGVNLIFVSPESLGAEEYRKNINIVNTACAKPAGPVDFWEGFKNMFKRGG